MITRHRDKAIKRLGLSFLFLILIVLLVGMRDLGLPKVLIAVGSVTLGTFALIFYVQGNIAPG